MRLWARRLVIGAGVVVAAILAAVACLAPERALIYRPVPRGLGPDPAGQIKAVEVKTADGETLVGWWLPPTAGKPTILFFHGNASSLEGDSGRWRRIGEAGVGFLAIAYRGYGGSTGMPTETGLHQDALAAYDWAAHRVSPDTLVIHGYSLGSGVAVRLASEKPARALVLEAPYTSITDIARRLTHVPVGLLMRDRYLSTQRIGKVRMPVLIIHGDQDRVIPFTQGEKLYALANEPKTFVRMIGSDHNTLTRDGAYDHIWRFLGLPIAETSAASGHQAETEVRHDP